MVSPSIFSRASSVGGIPVYKVETKPLYEKIDASASASGMGAAIPFSTEKVVQEELAIDLSFQILGCAFNSYWIIEQGDSLFLIDQHAACERRLYEEFSARKTNVSSQELLVPEHLVLQPREFEQAMEYQKELEELGYRFEKDGALREYRRLWIARINAGARMCGTNYSNLINGLKLAGVDVNRKVLAELAVSDMPAFKALVDVAMAAKN